MTEQSPPPSDNQGQGYPSYPTYPGYPPQPGQQAAPAYGQPPTGQPAWGATPAYPNAGQGGTPGYPSGGYGQQYGQPYAGGYGGGYGYQQPPRNGLGVASLVLGICATVLGFFFIGVLPGIVGIVLGLIARGRAKRGEATNGGMALAGVILSVVGILLFVLVIVLLVVNGHKCTLDNGNQGRCIGTSPNQT